ncbi:MAG: DUF2182 domain-containing protein [Pseudomonadota bacterium]
MGTNSLRRMTQGHWIALFGATLVLWALLFLMALPETTLAARGLAVLEAICSVTPGSAGFPTTVLMWAIMSAAMMAPTALPAFTTYDDLPGTTGAGLAALLWGYVVVWIGFAVVAAGLQVLFFHQGWLGALGQSTSVWLTAGLLAVAGLYQFSALKEACLSRCRAPLTFFMGHWAEGAFRNGLRLGADCLGCCWALMLLAFVGGTMNLAFMGLAMLLMTLEKLPDIGAHITKPLGGGLVALAILTPLSLFF